MQSARFEQELPRSHDAPWLARRALGDWYGAFLQADQVHRAKLLTSELVTNAVLHGSGRIALGAELIGDRLRVTVTDEGPGFTYLADGGRFDQRRGQGLAIVDAESTRWGIQDGSTEVWFELAVTIPAGTAPSAAGRS